MKSQQTQTTVDKHLLWHWWVPILCLGSTVSLIWLHRDKGVCMFTYNLPHAFLAEWPGHFACYCGYTGLEWVLKKSQHKNLTLEKKILQPHLSEIKPAILQKWVGILPLSYIPAQNLLIMTKMEGLYRPSQLAFHITSYLQQTNKCLVQ